MRRESDGATESGAELTKHAEVRLRQRGYREADVDLVLTHGTSCDNGAVLTAGDARDRIDELKREIATVERLAGTVVVLTDDESVITVYRVRRGIARRMLGRGRRHHTGT